MDTSSSFPNFLHSLGASASTGDDAGVAGDDGQSSLADDGRASSSSALEDGVFLSEFQRYFKLGPSATESLFEEYGRPAAAIRSNSEQGKPGGSSSNNSSKPPTDEWSCSRGNFYLFLLLFLFQQKKNE
jgi:hypothetical protein